MQLDALKYFLYVVEDRSISKAAKKAHISQSALSQMIHKLEEDLGYELLNRSNRGVTLTPMGEIVIKYANNIIKNFDKMMVDLSNHQKQQSKITVTGTWSLVAYSLPCMIYNVKKRFPEVEFDLVAKNLDEILSDIKNDLSDLGFIDVYMEEEDNLMYYNMGKEKVVLIAKSDYKIPDKITLSELVDVELIMCTINKKTCENIDISLKPLHKKLDNLNIMFKADSLTAVKSSILNGFGVAFVPYESIKYELYEEAIKLIEVEGLNLDYDIYMVSKKTKELSEVVRASREYLIEEGRKSFC
ncbi:LysR family transcriptional regulator [Petrocella atlantisensis]|uniref:LysR family transcriptional regulator n=1 Tax=Petrocella atlantisensis TaxID=2173034 RepID=A0A3P7PJG3_9FIRM|nr:LysR family transcriptional regulator [Petrocella atlantisensis]PKM55722.1 MAG: LysR family transcriptional regulator [Firmicutes bacterium HGW-Firmicutes-5]VDN49088.1 LysR family transcriptional regulator [Petrocella atlantisensis]